MPSQKYDSIQEMDDIAHVRHRPALYLGDVTQNEYDSALTHTVREIVSNSVDEHLAGHGNFLKVHLKTDANTISVFDCGRGVPFENKDASGRRPIEVAFGALRSSGKFNKTDDDSAYKTAGGLHGVGAACVNAVSEMFCVQSTRDGKSCTVGYRQGRPIRDPFIAEANPANHGTSVQWKPDPEILPFQFNPTFIKKYLNQVAYLNPTLEVVFRVDGDTYTLSQPRGLQALLDDTVPPAQRLIDAHEEINLKTPEGNTIQIVWAIADREAEVYHSFVNGISIESTSAPISAIKAAITRGITAALNATGHAKVVEEMSPADTRYGLTVITNLLHVDPAFDAQTKRKLVNTDLNKFISETVPDQITVQLIRHQDQLKVLLHKIERVIRARKAAAEARKRVMENNDTQTSRSTRNISLDIYTPPLTRNPQLNSLFLFEGQSAAGTLITAAKNINPKTGKAYKHHVGILALRGVVLNSLETSLDRVMNGKARELPTLIEVLGLNPKNPSDLSRLQFKDIVIATDEDEGGSHITVLLATFFAAHFPAVIENGHLYKVRTPLFEIRNLKDKKRVDFIYSWENREARLIELGYNPAKAGIDFDTKRCKGLGELGKEAAMTLVQDPKLEPIRHNDAKQLVELLKFLNGEAHSSDRRNLLFDLGLTQPDDLIEAV